MRTWFLRTHAISGANFLTLACVLGSFVALPAAEPERLKVIVERSETRFESEARKIVRSMIDTLEKAMEGAKRAGNLSLLQDIEADLVEFQRIHRLPESLPNLFYRRRLTLELERCLAVYQTAIATATKSDELSIANRLQKEQEKLEKRFDETYPKTRLRRILWEHSNGKFEAAKGNVWYEQTPHTRYSFIETDRDLNCVYLWDQSRDICIILNESQCVIKTNKGKPKVIYFGQWKKLIGKLP